jgi:two-component system nitrogen regulation response regulator NtrX
MGAVCAKSQRCSLGLTRYTWPGNVRELRNVIERIVIMNPTTSRFERKRTPRLSRWNPPSRWDRGSTLHQARAAYERDYILETG